MTDSARVLTLTDGPHRLSPPSMNAIIDLQSHGCEPDDAFELTGLFVGTRAEVQEAIIAADDDHPFERTPDMAGIRDHLGALLRDSGEDIDNEAVGKLMRFQDLSEYVEVILSLGKAAFGGPFDSEPPKK